MAVNPCPSRKLDKLEMGTQHSQRSQPTQPTEVNIEFDVESGDRNLDLSKKYHDDESSSMSSNALNTHLWNRSAIISAGIAIFGILAGTLFLSYGIAASNSSQEQSFRLVANEIANEFELAWGDYVTAAKWLHHACQHHPINRTDFRDIYEHVSCDLDIQVRIIVIALIISIVRYGIDLHASINPSTILTRGISRLPNGSQKYITMSEPH